MAKGKFKKRMHQKEMDLNKLRDELVKPTENGYALARNKEHKEYMDNLASELFEEATEMHKYVSARNVYLHENTMLFRERKSNDTTGFTIYINCEEMSEFAEKYHIRVKYIDHFGKYCMFFIPDKKGRSLSNGNSTYPFMSFMEKNLVKQIEDCGGIRVDSEYPIRKWKTDGNQRFWYIFM